jgi:stage IV sporulation protein A
VISEHSTIGILVTTDGSITDIGREAYVEAEERVANELKSLGKPFAIVLNSKDPGSDSAHSLALELEEKYGVPVALVSCPNLNSDDIREILGLILGEFPVRELKFRFPAWTTALPENHPLIDEMYAKVDAFSSGISRFSDIISRNANSEGIEILKLDAGDGKGELSLPLGEEVYFSTLSELTGLDVGDEKKLFACLGELSAIKTKYERIASALSDVETKGYGIVVPTADEMRLDEPRVIKQSSGYAVNVTAHAETIHMIKAKIKTDVSPVVGTQEQTDEVAKYLSTEYDDDPEKVWSYTMFGRSMYDLVKDGMNAKLMHMPDEARNKMGETLERIINEGASGLICILL